MAKTRKTIPARPSAVSDSPIELESSDRVVRTEGFVFGKATFIWIGIGILTMLVGMALMAGGGMPSPDVWDDEIIYSFRRITLAPIVILSGLGIVTFAILKK